MQLARGINKTAFIFHVDLNQTDEFCTFCAIFAKRLNWKVAIIVFCRLRTMPICRRIVFRAILHSHFPVDLELANIKSIAASESHGYASAPHQQPFIAHTTHKRKIIQYIIYSRFCMFYARYNLMAVYITMWHCCRCTARCLANTWIYCSVLSILFATHSHIISVNGLGMDLASQTFRDYPKKTHHIHSASECIAWAVKCTHTHSHRAI